MSNKSLTEKLAQAKATSPLNDLTTHQAALRASNALKKGTETGKVTKGAFKDGNEAWNKGKSGKTSWGKTRREKAKEMSEEERRAYFGYHETHTEETKEQMSESAKQRWAKNMKKVMADGIVYENHYTAAEALGIHKDTVIYRIKAKGNNWNNWYYID